jgi:hypothetical protein
MVEAVFVGRGRSFAYSAKLIGQGSQGLETLPEVLDFAPLERPLHFCAATTLSHGTALVRTPGDRYVQKFRGFSQTSSSLRAELKPLLEKGESLSGPTQHEAYLKRRRNRLLPSRVEDHAHQSSLLAELPRVDVNARLVKLI